jgi:hypothetical protein
LPARERFGAFGESIGGCVGCQIDDAGVRPDAVADDLRQGLEPLAIARLDRTIKFEQNRTKISGTFTVTVFPLQTGNPQGPGGTVLDSANFTGNLVTP